MELDELHVLDRQTGAQRHAVAVARTGVGARAGEIDAPVAARGQDGGMGAEAVDGAVAQVPRDRAAARAVVVHQQVGREILDEELSVMLQRLLVERVQDGVAGAVGRRAGALGGAFAVMGGHAAEGALVDLALGRAREGHAVMLQLDHRGHGLAHHVFDRVLVAEPVGALDRVVHVPAPIVLAHVAERGAHTALGRDCVAARRENLGDAGRLQPLLGQAKGGAQARAASADDNDVVLVVDDGIGLGHLRASLRRRS